MREVVVTGIGLVSCAGEGVAAHLSALDGAAAPPLDLESCAPYPVHPAPALNWDLQIAKKADQRQMEPWQRLGCYAAGLALDGAGAKADPALKARMQLVVAAGGGERDLGVDAQILTGLADAENPGVYLNERLMGDLRPTLFLAQLSNLLAGNISIVHGVTGASRTFMGEEASGVDALRIAASRIAHAQAEITLVGGAYNAERPDALLTSAMGGFLWKGPFRPVWERPALGGGFIPGSGAAFLVLEAREHAAARGARPIAALAGAAADRTRRRPGAVAAALARLWQGLGAKADLVLSGATGVKGITEEEADALRTLSPDAKIRATGDLVGHTMEAQPLFGAALAAAAIDAGVAGDAVVTSVGHWRAEGVLHLRRAA